jgi:hypothetical protein
MINIKVLSRLISNYQVIEFCCPECGILSRNTVRKDRFVDVLGISIRCMSCYKPLPKVYMFIIEKKARINYHIN